MDDYNTSVLSEAKNEYSANLVNILTPLIIQGLQSIFKEACNLCQSNDEDSKYLMTFQNFLTRVPKWNQEIINNETKRIIQQSKCSYLEDLLTCVHITQLKVLTSIRVATKQKKIDINIPSVDKFIHNIYINVARKLYTNIYLFEKDLYPLQIQKNKHEVEYLVKESILLTIRDNIPVERILQCYMEENEEVEIPNEPVEKPVEQKETTELALDKPDSKSVENIPVEVTQSPNLTESRLEKLVEELKSDKEETIAPKLVEPDVKKVSDSLENNQLEDNLNELDNKLSIDFSDKDMIVEPNGVETEINAPKDLATLEKIAEVNNAKRKEEEEDEDDEEQDKLNIGQDASLELDVVSL